MMTSHLRLKMVLALTLNACALCSGVDTVADKSPVIGIDLGTTFSCVGILRSGGVEIIPNDQGNRITPSYVGFLEEGRVIGEAAKNVASSAPTQIVYDVKRIIGRRFTDQTVQEDMKHLPFKIVEDDGKLKIEVSVDGVRKQMTPEEVSSLVLTKLKETAEAFLGEKVSRAVIAVPAYFTNAQREATKDAGTLAGLDVLRVINEPTAAAMAYNLDKTNESNIIVYDLGGGTFDASLLTVSQGVVEVIATNGDTHLGGEDFDQRVADHFVTVFRDLHGLDVSADKKAMSKLKRAAEAAKITLSSKKEATVEVDSLFEGKDFQTKLSRAKFEELNIELFRKTIDPLKRLLEDGKKTKDDIHEVVLVGGSTRIPRVQDLLQAFFNGKKLNHNLNADEAVAYGAAMQAGVLAGTAEKETLLLDIMPITLGLENDGGIFYPMVPRNTAIPTSKTAKMITPEGDATIMNIAVYEGERKLTKDCTLLGQFQMQGFPAGVQKVQHEITYDVDANGILNVKAVITDDRAKDKASKDMTIERDNSRLTKAEIEALVKEAEDNEAADKIAKEIAEHKAGIDRKLELLKYRMAHGVRERMTADDLGRVEKAIEDLKLLRPTFDEDPYDVPKQIIDPASHKPEGWNEDIEPGQVLNPDAKIPEDWDADEDGDWEPELIDNPACSVGCGPWVAPYIENPDHRETKKAAALAELAIHENTQTDEEAAKAAEPGSDQDDLQDEGEVTGDSGDIDLDEE